MAYFDHWIKEEKRIKYYYRYADDIVILGSDKNELHSLLHEIRCLLYTSLTIHLIFEEVTISPIGMHSAKRCSVNLRQTFRLQIFIHMHAIVDRLTGIAIFAPPPPRTYLLFVLLFCRCNLSFIQFCNPAAKFMFNRLAQKSVSMEKSIS